MLESVAPIVGAVGAEGEFAQCVEFLIFSEDPQLVRSGCLALLRFAADDVAPKPREIARRALRIQDFAELDANLVNRIEIVLRHG
jgi:hypothetical protein